MGFSGRPSRQDLGNESEQLFNRVKGGGESGANMLNAPCEALLLRGSFGAELHHKGSVGGERRLLSDCAATLVYRPSDFLLCHHGKQDRQSNG